MTPSKPTLADNLRATAEELDRLDPCTWQHAWSDTVAALTRGNPDWCRDNKTAPIEAMEAELARLYDIERMFKKQRRTADGLGVK
jgi:hypothetical protein